MRSVPWTILILLLAVGHLQAATGKIKKVLPHWVDQTGKHSPSPSLYERDTYQAYLREHRDQCSALRFDVHWTAQRRTGTNLVLRVEMRGSGQPEPITISQPVKRRRWFGRWTRLWLKGEAFERLDKLAAWRVTLWDGDRMLAEQKSFLW